MKKIISLIIILILLMVSFIFLRIYMVENDWHFKFFIFREGYVKEIDGKEYYAVATYSNRFRKEVFYYENHNIFAYQKTKEFIEEFYDYDDYEHPEFREYHKENIGNSIIYYYDDDGNITSIKKRDEKGKIVDVE